MLFNNTFSLLPLQYLDICIQNINSEIENMFIIVDTKEKNLVVNSEEWKSLLNVFSHSFCTSISRPSVSLKIMFKVFTGTVKHTHTSYCLHNYIINFCSLIVMGLMVLFKCSLLWQKWNKKINNPWSAVRVWIRLTMIHKHTRQRFISSFCFTFPSPL